VADDRHRRVPRRRPGRSRLSRARHPLVPVRPVVPDPSPARTPPATNGADSRPDRRPERGVVVRRRRVSHHLGGSASARATCAVHPHADAGRRRDRPAPECGRSGFDHPSDERAWTIEDEFLFGPDVLVAPITELGARSRHVYLPAGANWQDIATRAVLSGGDGFDVDPPLERIPVFVREGADNDLARVLLQNG
jgi:hypothetical protein